MATLQKIRNHGTFLLIVVGVAMLAFILGDFFNSSSSFFHRDREYVGEIAGHSIHYTEYEAAREQLTEVYKIESGRSDFDEQTYSQIRNQVWQMMLMNYSLGAQAEKIGMDITADELSELCIGAEPHQLIKTRRAFYDENGEFSRDNLVRFLQQIETAEDDGQNDNMRQAKSYWMYWENAVRLTHLQEKYSNLTENLITANSLDAQQAYNARQQSMDVQYVSRPYSAIADSLVTVSKKEVRKLYEQRRPLYKQTPNRAIEYITFDIKPSEEDFAQTLKAMEDLKQEFTTTDDLALVVNSNSDVLYDGRNYSETTVPEKYKDFAFGKDAKKDATTDITLTDDTYSMARIVECGYNMPDSVKLKAVATAEDEEDNEIGWVTETMLPKQISEPAFAAKKGTRFSVDMGAGEQTFEVMDVAKATPKVKLAILERKVTPSSRTYSALYNQAKQFVVANQTEEQLRTSAKEQNLTLYPAYNLTKNSDKAGSLTASRNIVRWAFEAKEGQVSDVFECGQQYVVAVLTQVNEDEYRPLSEVETELRLKATNNAKAEMLKKEMAEATSLEQAAEKFNTTVQTANGVTFGSYRFGNVGAEPAVIGTAFAMEEGKVSQPIQGNAGVYMIVAGAKTTAEGEMDKDAEIRQLNNRYSYLNYQIISYVEDNTEVTDNRFNFQ